MKSRLTIALVASAAIITAEPSLRGSQAGPEALIESARAVLKAPELPHEAVTIALADVLSASLLIMPETD
jgi:hypothetical protein